MAAIYLVLNGILPSTPEYLMILAYPINLRQTTLDSAVIRSQGKTWSELSEMKRTQSIGRYARILLYKMNGRLVHRDLKKCKDDGGVLMR